MAAVLWLYTGLVWDSCHLNKICHPGGISILRNILTFSKFNYCIQQARIGPDKKKSGIC